MQRTTAYSIALLASLLQPSLVSAKTYIVKPGDTLSGIAQREVNGPIYGKKGSLQKLINLNPEIKNPNRIYPAQAVILSPEEASATAAAEAEAAVEPLEQAAPLAGNEASASQPSYDAETAPSPSFGFSVHGILSGTELKVTGKDRSFKTDLESALSKGIQVRGYYFLNDSSQVGIEVKALDTEYSDTRDGRFVGREKVLKEIGAFYQVSFAKDWHFEIMAGSEQAFFVAQEAASTFRLESVFVDSASLALSYDLYKSEPLTWSLGLNSAYNLAAEGRTVEVNSGYSYGALSGLAYEMKEDTYLEGGIFYDRRIQDTEDAKQKAAESGMTLGLRLDY